MSGLKEFKLVPNDFILIIAIILLGAIALSPTTDPEMRTVSLGAIIGLTGGHLNGRHTVGRKNED